MEPSPPSSLSPRDQCHPSALRSQHEPTHDAHLGKISTKIQRRGVGAGYHLINHFSIITPTELFHSAAVQ